MDRLYDTANSYEMKINVKKTKVMKVSRNAGLLNMTVDGQKVEQVSSSIWALGSPRMKEVRH